MTLRSLLRRKRPARQWVELELLNGWEPIEHFPPPAYLDLGDGRFWIRGSAQGGAFGTAITVLPIRPAPECCGRFRRGSVDGRFFEDYEVKEDGTLIWHEYRYG